MLTDAQGTHTVTIIETTRDGVWILYWETSPGDPNVANFAEEDHGPLLGGPLAFPTPVAHYILFHLYFFISEVASWLLGG